MKRILAVVVASLVLVACSTIGQFTGASLEEQIATGANTGRAATAVARVLSSNNKITLAQARSYNVMLHSANEHLNDANKVLVACRAKTGSSQASVPDPCVGSVADDIQLGVSIATDVKRVLDSK